MGQEHHTCLVLLPVPLLLHMVIFLSIMRGGLDDPKLPGTQHFREGDAAFTLGTWLRLWSPGGSPSEEPTAGSPRTIPAQAGSLASGLRLTSPSRSALGGCSRSGGEGRGANEAVLTARERSAGAAGPPLPGLFLGPRTLARLGRVGPCEARPLLLSLSWHYFLWVLNSVFPPFFSHS